VRPHGTDAPPPEVTVVIPTRNRHALLSEHGLLAALSQEGVDAEVVVVDDGSTDGTAERLAQLDEPRLRVIRNDQPQGQGAARNRGIAAARAPWIAFLDDDDLWSPGKLRVQLDLARATDADFAYCGAILVYEDGTLLAADPVPDAGALRSLLLERDVIPAGASNILARAELVRALDGFDETLPYSADWDLWIRLALDGRGVACDDILVGHFKHGGNDLFRSRPDVVREFERVLEKHAALLEPGAVRHARRGLTEWLVHEYREAGYSRARAYLEGVRGQPSLRDAGGAAADLSRERLRRSVAHVARRLPGRAAVAGAAAEAAVEAPEWLRLYRSGRELRP
jgi:glycosyltransferase involved in cell wall biosynthesis